MKITGVVRLSLLLLLTLSTDTALAQIVKCDRFELKATLEGDYLLVSLYTDLPDSADLMVGVSRSYWAGHPIQEYPVEYIDAHSTVGEWRKPRRVDLDNAAWKAKFADRLRYLAQIMKPMHVTKVDNVVTVSFVVPINQSDPRFGKRNQNLVGRKVASSGLRVVTAEVKVPCAIGKVPHLSSVNYGDPENLRRGARYRLSRETPLGAGPHPTDPLRAASSNRRLSVGTIITVLAVDGSEPPHPWYRVRASTTSGAHLGTGWVNGLALIGQQLMVVAQ
jgi:hypothetical protein